MYTPTRSLPFVALGLFAAPAAGQVFAINTTQIPTGSPDNDSHTENIDFADVDLDGDWDVAFADGGDLGNDQSRLWINSGGLQGGALGNFVDETAPRFPGIFSQSRDIEFADIDNDLDYDIHVSNTSAFSDQGGLFWVNAGGAQGGALGFYKDETAARWVGVGGAGSSVSPSQVLSSGGFYDWSHDTDFADADNDGDLDLFHSSYGPSFGALVPSRLFLNDGNGYFTEFNPSGVQLSGAIIPDGTPAIWAEGVHRHGTTDTSGAEADIADNPLDVELQDIDGDFDLDLLHGSRDTPPRLFRNRLEETGGTLRFRDVSHAVLPGNWATSGSSSEQEMGDLDRDGDVDILGLDWVGSTDATFINDGAGAFAGKASVPGSGSVGAEGDLLDYDNDGDLDVIVASLSGDAELYENHENGTGTFSFDPVSPGTSGLGGTGQRAKDVEACDVDADGDYDVFLARDLGSPNLFLENLTQTADLESPYLPRLEDVGPQTAAPGVVPVRAHVYDNAPSYITWYHETALRVSVNGCRLPDVPMVSSGGQVFRGELPANLVGAVAYRASSTDEHGNEGSSGQRTYTASSPDSFASEHGVATPGSLGDPRLEVLSAPFGSGSTLYLAGTNLPAGAPWLLYLTDTALATPISLPGLATLNIGGTILLELSGTADDHGCALVALPISGAAAGATVHGQLFAVDGVGADLLSATRGVSIKAL